MPFGLCNAPVTFERLMEQVLSGLPWEVLLIYLDDIIVYAMSFQEMMDRLRLVFTRLREANLKLSPNKCHLFQDRVKYLGHLVSQQGICTDPEEISGIQDWPIPTSVSDLRTFIGLCSYYRRYVKGFADLAKPLFKLQDKGADFVWTETWNISFKTLKTHQQQHQS